MQTMHYAHLRAQGLRKGDEHRAYVPDGNILWRRNSTVEGIMFEYLATDLDAATVSGVIDSTFCCS